VDASGGCGHASWESRVIMSDLMATVVISIVTAIIILLTWQCGYSFGKADGLRIGRRMLDEQWRDYEKFRDLVFRVLKIEEDR